MPLDALEVLVIKLKLVRKPTTPEYTEGDLYVNEEWFAFVLEDTVRKGKKVYGQTAIPAGTYRVAATMSNRFKKVMVQILDVPGFEGVRIHQGSSAADSAACPLISKRRGQTPGHLAAMKAGILTDELTRMVKEAGGGSIEVIDG
jgi:hypothetical protein